MKLGERLATDEDGGIVAFVGRTRATPGTPAPGQEAEAARHADRRVDGLEYEAFEPMAVRVLDEIADEIEARFGVRRLAIVHRSGAVPLGEASVIVVAVAPHRDAAFAAARYAIDETKARAPIWKAERFTDGHVWVGHVARTGPSRRRPDRRFGLPGYAATETVGLATVTGYAAFCPSASMSAMSSAHARPAKRGSTSVPISCSIASSLFGIGWPPASYAARAIEA